MIKNLLKDSIVYGATKYFGVMAAIFLTPVYTRLLTKADYGVMDLFLTWSNLVIMILPLGIITSMIRYYPDYARDTYLKKKNLGTILVTISVISLGYALVMLFLKNIIGAQLTDIENSAEIYYHGIFIIVGEVLTGYFLVLLQVRFEKFKYLFVSLAKLIVLISLGFLLVYYYQTGITGFFRASSISVLLGLILSTCFLYKEISFSFDYSILKKTLSYSIHLLSAGFLFQLTFLIDRFLILQYFSLEAVGVYSIGNKISGFVSLATSSFAVAWFPIAMKIKDDVDAKETYKKVHDLYFLLSFVFLSGIFLFRKELIFIFAPSYNDSYEIISILSLYTIVNASIYLYTLGLHIKDKTSYLTLVSLVSVVVNTLSSLILLKLIGLPGVAWGTLFGTLVWVLIQLYLSNKYFPVAFNYLLPIGCFLFLILLMFLGGDLDEYFNVITVTSVSVKSFIYLMIITSIFFTKAGSNLLKNLIHYGFENSGIIKIK